MQAQKYNKDYSCEVPLKLQFNQFFSAGRLRVTISFSVWRQHSSFEENRRAGILAEKPTADSQNGYL
jgi:hypothetical protein